MEYRQFGQTDLRVSAIGFGCWEISGTYGQIDEAHFTRAVHRAVDSGINCFDTAEAYGMGISERALAKALGARRKDVAVVTKGGVGYPDAPNRRDSTRRRLTAALDNSLRNLGTDHVDVYLVHWPDVNTPFEETMRTLDDAVRQGKTRYIGVSNFRLEQLDSLHGSSGDIDVVQYGWNMFDRRMQREIFPWCQANDVGVMAYGSLAYGLLSGTFHAGMTFDETDWRAKRGDPGELEPVPHHVRPRSFRREPRGGGGARGPSPRAMARRCRSWRSAGPWAARAIAHVARGLPPPGRSRGEPGRAGLAALARRDWPRSTPSSPVTTPSRNRRAGWRTIRRPRAA